jgi:lysophospholipase L1-like esterase
MTITISLLGDSLTAMPTGTVGQDGIRWSDLIKAGAVASTTSITLYNDAVNGKTSAYGLVVETPVALSQHPDAVILEFNMNDAYTAQGISLEQSAVNVAHIVVSIESQNSNTVVYLMTTNNPTSILTNQVPYLAVYQEEYRKLVPILNAAGLHVGLIDNELSWATVDTSVVGGGVMFDNWHPTLAADVLHVVPDVMHALGLTFPVIDPGLSAAVPAVDAPVALLYQAVFARVPDLVGLNYWIAQLSVRGINGVAENFAPYVANVAMIYENTLCRNPTPAEAAQPISLALVGVVTSADALAHATAWLATF